MKKWRKKEEKKCPLRAQDLCEQGGGPRFSLPIPFSRPSLISPTVSVDVQHHERRKPLCHIPEAVWTGRSVWTVIAYPIYFSPIPNKPYGFCGRKAPRKKEETQPSEIRSCVKTGRWTWALTPCSIIPPSLISHAVSVEVQHHERRHNIPRS